MNTRNSPARALVVIDVQNEYFAGGRLEVESPCADRSLVNILRAIDAALLASVPVIVVRHEAPAGAPLFQAHAPGGQLHPDIEHRRHDLSIVKHTPSAFCETGLAEWLDRHGIDTLAVTGYMTQNCIAATIFDAMQRGFAVEFLADAAAALAYANKAGSASAQEIHQIFSVVFQSNFAAVVTTEEWLAALGTGERLAKGNVLASAEAGRRRGAMAR